MSKVGMREETARFGARAPAKGQRLDIRVAPAVKDLIQQAAELQGQSVTDFMLGAVLPEARRVVLEHSVILMSRKGQAQLVDLLLNPPAPNAKLRALAAKYRNADKGD